MTYGVNFEDLAPSEFSVSSRSPTHSDSTRHQTPKGKIEDTDEDGSQDNGSIFHSDLTRLMDSHLTDLQLHFQTWLLRQQELIDTFDSALRMSSTKVLEEPPMQPKEIQVEAPLILFESEEGTVMMKSRRDETSATRSTNFGAKAAKSMVSAQIVRRRWENLQFGSTSHILCDCWFWRWLHPRLQTLEASFWFNILTCSVIATNTVMLCISVESMSNQEPVSFGFWEWAFVVYYTAELSLRALVHQFNMLLGPDRHWNVLDTFLVVVAWSEQIGEASGTSRNMSYLRGMRLLKVAKVLRLFRLMRTFRELRSLLDSIIESVRTLLWTIVLMSGTMLIFALAFVQATLTSDDPDRGDSQYWTSIGPSMLDLLMAITGGIDWVALIDPLWSLGLVYVLAFIMYIMFQVFVVSNAIQSLFVQRLLDYWARDDYAEMAIRLQQKTGFIRKVAGVFKEMDTDHDGLVHLKDLEEYMKDHRMLAFAHSLDMEEEDMGFAFGVLTQGGKVPVDIDTFVTGCIKIRGTAKSLDMIDLSREQRVVARNVKRIKEAQNSFISNYQAEFAKVHESLNLLRSGVVSRSVQAGAFSRTSADVPAKRTMDVAGNVRLAKAAGVQLVL